MTDDLVAFLRARLAEDEKLAREVHYEGQRWISEEETVYRWPEDELVFSADRKRDAAHIVRWGPARVLAEVEAKRRIIAENDTWGEDDRVLRLLALPYADHSDYQQEWAPMIVGGIDD